MLFKPALSNQTMAMKGQNAMEFIFTYSIVITIITVAIAFVIIFANAGRSLVPAQCSFFGGFTCSFVVYTSSTGSNSVAAQLLLIATDTQPGIVNVSSFNALIGSAASTSGQCTPNVATAGQSIYCTADFSSAALAGTLYTGSFNISAGYCPHGMQLYSYSCAADSNYSYKGNMQVQASSLPIGANTVAVYLPITMTNGQIVQSKAGLQVPVSFSASSYAAHANSNLGNIRFYDGAIELYSWCESGCSNTSSNTIFFVKLDRSIPAGSAIDLQAYFLPMSVNYDGVHAGEAPQLSPVYAEYDNGANVFNNYWNGAQLSTSTLPSTWSGSEAVGSFAYYSTPISTPFIVDSYMAYPASPSTTYSTDLLYSASSVSDYSGISNNNGNAGFYVIYQGTFGNEVTSYTTTESIFTVEVPSLSTQTDEINYADAQSFTSDLPSGGYYVGLYSASQLAKIDWLRTRTYPPNGIEPSASFGSITNVP
jgi:hypothetical protein